MAGGTEGATLVTNYSFSSSTSSLPDDCGDGYSTYGYGQNSNYHNNYGEYDDDMHESGGGLSAGAIAAIVVISLVGVLCVFYTCCSVKFGSGDQQRHRHIIAYAESTERDSRNEDGRRRARAPPVAAALSRVATAGDIEAVNSARRSGVRSRIAAADDGAFPLAVATAATATQCVELTAMIGPAPPHLLEEGRSEGGRDSGGGGGAGSSSGRVALRGGRRAESRVEGDSSMAPVAAVMVTAAKPVTAVALNATLGTQSNGDNAERDSGDSDSSDGGSYRGTSMGSRRSGRRATREAAL